MTNYERIKNMSIEELAVSLMCPAEIDCTFDKKTHCKDGENCVQCTMEYLKREE